MSFGCSPVPKTRTRAHSPKPPFYETALFFPLDLCAVLPRVVVFGEFELGNRAILGGEERTTERTLQNWFWKAQKMGLVWSVPLPSKENDRA